MNFNGSKGTSRNRNQTNITFFWEVFEIMRFRTEQMVGATGIEPVTPTMSKSTELNEISDLEGLDRSKNSTHD